MPVSSITYAKRKLEIKLSVESTEVTIRTKVKAKTMEGLVSTSDGDLKITSVRIVEKKK